MRIVHLCKNDLQGGAARAAYRLHKGLQQSGCDSSMFVVSKTSDDASVSAFSKPMNLANVVQRGLRQICLARRFDKYSKSRPAGLELFSDDRCTFGRSILGQMCGFDVINLHWVPGFVDYKSFFRGIPGSAVVVWTLHDMNPFTGGCHYNLGCARYLQGCGKCPQLGSSQEGDLSSDIWHRKRNVFASIPTPSLRIVAPSKWLASEAKASPILHKFPVSVIPNGLDLEEFAPRNRASVRELLGVPQDARVLLFVAEDVGNQRKGFALLVEAVARCARNIPNLLVMSLGQNRPSVPAGVDCRHIGPVNNDQFLSMVYSAADLFAICSLQDNLPNTVLEAMACGIPIVGYAVGGIPDMVRNEVNGLTVTPGDAQALADAICTVLGNKDRCTEMGVNARRIAIQDYSVEQQARRYGELYSTPV